jgi:capsular exopolysaccharide synthesis family protein
VDGADTMAEQLPADGRGFPAPYEGGLPARAAAAALQLPGDAGEEGFDWRRYLAALLRFKWPVFLITVLGTSAGFFVSRRLPSTYQAQATIWVPSGPAQGPAGGPIQQPQVFSSVGWIELIKTSFVVLDDVVRDLRLYLSVASTADSATLSTLSLKQRFVPGRYELEVAPSGATFTLRNGQGLTIQQGSVGDSVGAALGFAWVPAKGALRPGQKIAFALLPPRDAALRLQQQLSVQLNQQGASFLALRLQGSNATRVAATLNKVAEGFVDSAKALTNAKSREVLQTLHTQLAEAEARLREAEVALETFKVQTITLPTDRASPVAAGLAETRNSVMQNFMDMKFELDGLKQDREAITRALDEARGGQLAPDALLYIKSVQQSADLSKALQDLTVAEAGLRALRLRYTEENPDVQRAAAQVRETKERSIPDLARALLAEMSARERELSLRIGSASSELREIPRRATEEQRLQREQDVAANQYQRLKVAYQDALFAQSAGDLGARVLDWAVVPESPIRDTAVRVIGLAFMASLGLGLLGALLLDRLDRRVRYPEQVSRDLGLPILGAIPRVKTSGNGRVVRATDTAHVVEALRGVRLGLVHAHGAAGPLMVTVTSPGPAEGKSFVVSNLALAFADAGHRTILLDGDVRRGELHRLLGVSRKPGLTDFLKGTVSREDVVQRTNYPSLHFVGGGTRMNAAPELLASAALSQLLLSLRGAYDVILLDSPPLGAGVDPYVLGAATGNLLLVLRTGVTDRELAEAKLDMIDRLPIRILGAILNDVQPTGHYRYYGYHYYVEGYESRDEAAEQAAERNTALPTAGGDRGL